MWKSFERPLLPPAKPGVWPSRRVLELKQAVLYTQELELPVFRTLDFSGRLIKDTFNGFSRTWMRLLINGHWISCSPPTPRLRRASG